MTYLAATLYVNRLYQEQRPKIALGEDGLFDNIIGGVKDAFHSFMDPKHSMLANFFSFIGPGILFKLGFPWMAVAYEVAAALGFDWAGIWDSIKNSVVDIFSNLFKGSKPSQEELYKQLDDATQETLSKNVTDKVDEEALEAAQKKAQKDEPMPPSTGTISTHHLIKKAGIFRSAARSRGLLTRLFRRLIPVALTTLAVSLGFAVAGGAASGALGIKRNKPEDATADTSLKEEKSSTTHDPIYDLKVSPSADPSLFEFNKNDASSVWLESGSIENIKETIMGWILSAFPDLAKEKDRIVSSRPFIEVMDMFRARNKMAQGLQIYSVPKPFQKKIDIVSYIVNGYLKTRGN